MSNLCNKVHLNTRTSAVPICTTLILTALVTGNAFAGSQTPALWQQGNDAGMKLAESGDLRGAQAALAAAAEQVPKEAANSVQAALLFNNLGFVDLELADYRHAEPLLARAVEILKDSQGQTQEHEANACDNLGRLYWRSGQFAKAETLLLKALSLQEGKPKYNADFLATRYENLGEFYSQQGDYALAETALRKALSLREQSAGKPSDLVTSLVKVATVCQSQKKVSEANELLTRASKLSAKDSGESSEQTKNLKLRLEQNQHEHFPDLLVLSPRAGQLFTNEPVVVTVSVENFKLERPEPKFDHPKSTSVGHIHYMVDNHPPMATDATRIMIEGGPAFLDAGEHTLWIELVNEVHQPLTPPVRRKVKFQLKH